MNDDIMARMSWVDLPPWAADVVFSDVTVRFGWRDRLLILLGRPLHINAQTRTAQKVGRVESLSRVRIERFWWPGVRRSFAVAEAPRAEATKRTSAAP